LFTSAFFSLTISFFPRPQYRHFAPFGEVHEESFEDLFVLFFFFYAFCFSTALQNLRKYKNKNLARSE